MGAITILEEINVMWRAYEWGEFRLFYTTPEIIKSLTYSLVLLLAINLITLIVTIKRKK
jgi:hypothetical protein